MKKILPIIVIGILVLSGIGAVAISKENLFAEEKSVIYDHCTIEISSIVFKDSKEDYIEVELEEISSYFMNPGKPILPKIVKTFELPFGVKNTNVEVIANNIKEIEINQKICPSPIHLPLIANTDIDIEVKSVKDTKVYSSNEKYPSTWYKSFIRCGLNSINERVTHLILHIYPIRYAPALNKLYVAENTDVKISYNLPDSNPFPLNSEYDLVIIAPDKFSKNLEKLVAHKENFNVRTLLKTTEDIYDDGYGGVDRPEDIKLFIKDAIETYGITYVLLVGGLKNKIWTKPRDNTNQGTSAWYLPVRYNNYIDNPEHPLTIAKIHDPGVITDLYFADIYKKGGEFEDWDPNDDGIFAAWGQEGVENDSIDLAPDVCVGRLACRNTLEVRNVVNKIINYEKTAAGDWFKKVITISGDGFLDQMDLDFQWNTNELEDGEYIIYAQSTNSDNNTGPVEEIHITLDKTVETCITFNHNDNERIVGYPSCPVAEIVSISEGDILGNTDHEENISEGDAYGNSVTGWANINYTNGILHIRGKTYDPQAYGIETNIHVWIKNGDGEIVFSDWRNASKTYYEGEWVVGERMISGFPGATYYVTEDFEIEHLWASNGKLTGMNDVIEALSQGCGFAFFSGHGSPNVWADHYPGIPGGRGSGSVTGLKVSNIKIYPNFVKLPILPMRKIKNTNKPPVVIIGGCHNSQFNVSIIPAMLDIYNKKNTWCHGVAVPECFSWYLVKLPRTGAIASIGNTGLGYGVLGEDCTREGLDGGIGIEFYKQYFQEGQHILGAAYKETQMSYVSQFDLENLDHAKSLVQWVLLGDPSLMIGGYS